jgi:hypothetical protein
LGADTNVYVVGAVEEVMATFQQSGFDEEIVMLNEYDAGQIENLKEALGR